MQQRHRCACLPLRWNWAGRAGLGREACRVLVAMPGIEALSVHDYSSLALCMQRRLASHAHRNVSSPDLNLRIAFKVLLPLLLAFCLLFFVFFVIKKAFIVPLNHCCMRSWARWRSSVATGLERCACMARPTRMYRRCVEAAHRSSNPANSCCLL